MTPAKTGDLDELREAIDGLDNRIIALLNDRARVAQDIGKVKHAGGQTIYAPLRERKLLDRVTEQSAGPLSEESLRLIYREIISASLALEQPIHVAYLGPEATFAHQATKRHFGLSAQAEASRTIADVFDSVARGRCAYGVVPVESSSGGAVTHTLDLLVQSDLCITAEVLLETSNHLLTRSGTTTSIGKVYGEAETIEQCQRWLGEQLPGVPVIDVSSMGRAAELAAGDSTAAALGTDLAGALFGLKVATPRLDDAAGNLARFLVIARDGVAASGNDRTSLVFALNDGPGVLFSALEPLAKSGINMSRIESRPAHGRAWKYMFFVDVQGHHTDETVAAALVAMQKHCVFFRMLGSYPEGQL